MLRFKKHKKAQASEVQSVNSAESFESFDQKFLEYVEYLNQQIFTCTSKRITLYEEFKVNDPKNPNFNMDLSKCKLDETNFVTVGKSLHTLVMTIAANLSIRISIQEQECIQHDFSTLFCTIYKSFTSLVDVTYLINWYLYPESAIAHDQKYYKYFNTELKTYFLNDFHRLYKVFSK